MIRIKRAYEPPSRQDGLRVLIDRLWPRGLNKTEAGIDVWTRELAPSTGLRKWFSHDPAKWNEFKKRYAGELEENSERLAWLSKTSRNRTVTLVYSSKEEQYNNAVALKGLLDRRSGRLPARTRKKAA